MFVYGDEVMLKIGRQYRATFICQYGLCCCIVWPLFLFYCFVKIWATCENVLGKWVTAPPPRQKIARRLQLVVRIGAHARITQRLRNGSSNFSLIVFVLAVITKYPLTCAMFTSFLISYQGGCIRLR